MVTQPGKAFFFFTLSWRLIFATCFAASFFYLVSFICCWCKYKDFLSFSEEMYFNLCILCGVPAILPGLHCIACKSCHFCVLRIDYFLHFWLFYSFFFMPSTIPSVSFSLSSIIASFINFMFFNSFVTSGMFRYFESYLHSLAWHYKDSPHEFFVECLCGLQLDQSSFDTIWDQTYLWQLCYFSVLTLFILWQLYEVVFCFMYTLNSFVNCQCYAGWGAALDYVVPKVFLVFACYIV